MKHQLVTGVQHIHVTYTANYRLDTVNDRLPVNATDLGLCCSVLNKVNYMVVGESNKWWVISAE